MEQYIAIMITLAVVAIWVDHILDFASWVNFKFLGGEKRLQEQMLKRLALYSSLDFAVSEDSTKSPVKKPAKSTAAKPKKKA